MAIVTGDRYLESLALHELESLLAGAPVDYLRAYISDLGDHRALEQLRRILRLLTSLKVVSVLPPSVRDPTRLSLLPFGRLRVLELRGCDLSTSAARGLLELRHTLEKIICHNSTDALRHLFASRIVAIKDSPQWKRLSFVSCACNGLLLMDESLQLLPAVETLDLSRNKFSKVDNLRKCTKLKHLDLGFNHLRTISSFSEVSCHIVKLVMRNNALTTLRGIENLKSLEDLDLSYNVISNFSEIEILAGLPSLRRLWLEGNPICCARWYRAQVFSFFAHPDKVKLDEMEISTREFWKRQIIIASRQKRPASFGFYYPAREDAGEGGISTKRKKLSRLACIETEGSMYICSDQDSVSCDNEVRSKEDNAISDDEAEIVDLMKRVELMKKERSVLWLREFKEWMDLASDSFAEGNKYGSVLDSGTENYMRKKAGQRHLGESSRYVSDSVQASGDESGTDILESNNSFADISIGLVPQYVDRSGESGSMFALRDTGSHLSSDCPGSPPHYQEDLLHRRHILVEDILQLSAESYSVASSDSNTSDSNDLCEVESSVSEVEQSVNEEISNRKNGRYLLDSHAGQASATLKLLKPEQSLQLCSNDFCAGAHDGEIASLSNEEADWLDKKKCKRKPRKIVSVSQNNMVGRAEDSQTLVGNPDFCGGDMEDEQGEQIFGWNFWDGFVDGEQTWPTTGADDFIKNYFNLNIADSSVNETCKQYMRSSCFLELESRYTEREVAILLSSEHKLYVLLVDVTFDGSGTILKLLGCHRLEDVREVLVGVGLQVVRVYIERDAAYMFLTRSMEKSRQLLCTLQVVDSNETCSKCSLRSLEQVQVELFEKHICGGSKISIFQYSLVLFWRNNIEDELWLSRSLFVIGGHLLVCIEDFMQFSALSIDASSSTYFSLDSCCSITDVSEMVIEARESQCVTLALVRATSELCPSTNTDKEQVGLDKEKTASGSLTWKLKWFSEESLFKFVALFKAIHAGATMSPLPVRCIS
ncbi:unnamed protein product, partial [Vitis vinifera]